MATLLHSESRRLYSWWWDSHNSPKNSKWLQENLTDMDAKVKSMIKLIEEDADSFARRAEMYYKKRPELMKLVEEFYRAYRALAERYDHATVDLRQAHRDLAQAFPNQLPPEISDDSLLNTEPHTPDMPHPGRALFDPDESYVDAIGLSSSNLYSLEKNGIFSDEFNSRMKKGGIKQFKEVFGTEQSLHGGLPQLSNENQNLKIQVRSEKERASKAECDVQALRKTLDDMQSDREAVLILYHQSLEKISSLEVKIVLSEDHAQLLNEQTNIAETEVNRLRQAVDNSNEEKEDVAIRYKECLETIAKLENEICCAQEDLKQLSDTISTGSTKLKSSEERVRMLETNNQYLQSEVDNLLEKMLMKDRQLIEKDEEMGKIQSLSQDENSKLKEICKKEQYVNQALSEKLKTMEKRLEKDAALEKSFLDVSGELESSKEKIKSLQESFQVLQGEKCTSVDEKNTLFSHLEVLNEKIQKLWEKNTSLQNSLASANIELVGSREKAKCLEEICELLRNEKSNLLAEKGTLVFQLKNIEGMREKLEERFTESEDNNMSLENEKNNMIRQVEELRFTLSVEKKEHAEFTKRSESRLTSVEKQVCLLEEENKLIGKDFDAQLDEAMNAHVEIFILQKLIQDLEGKNLSLLNECQKYLEASQLSDKLFSELEAENLEQNMETEFLLDENKKLKKGISQMFKALKIDSGSCFEDKIELEHACLPLFLECIEKMKNLVSENEAKRQQLEELEAEKENLLLKFENMRKDYLDLQNRNTRALEDNRFLLKKKLELKKRNCMVEDENEIILHENLTYSTLSLIFQNLGMEKGSELKTIRKIVKTLEKECEDSKLIGDCQVNQVLELSKKNNNLTKEVEYLHEVNGKLESELSELHKEIEEHRHREENLSSELKDKSNEFEIWEAEAASFYFDLQFSSTREVLLESKVHELTGVCKSLEQESVSKSKEIGHMKEKLSLVANEVGELNEQLSAYVPLMVSLEDDIASFEHNALSRTKSYLTGIFESEDTNIDGEICENDCQEVPENKATVNPNGISDLQMMRRKIKAVEKAVIEHMERLAQEKILQINIKPKASLKEIESPKSNNNSTEKILLKENIDKTEISEAQNGTLMKDIPLDQVSDCAVSVIIRRRNVATDKQMLELWQTAEQNCTSTAIIKELITQEHSSTENDYMYSQFKNMNQINKDYPSSELEVEKVLGIDKLESPSIGERTKEGHKRRVLEKLASDAQKLMSIQVLVQDLRKKTDLTSKKGKDVNKQLQEVKEYVVQLMDINGQMTKNIASPSFSENKEAGILHRMRVLEQARKGSEKIEKLELEVQKLQLKLEDGKKSKAINRFSKNTTSTAFRNFIHIGRRSGRKHKKACLCGCLRPSTTEAEVQLGKMAG